jgi:hypothetical protein
MMGVGKRGQDKIKLAEKNVDSMQRRGDKREVRERKRMRERKKKKEGRRRRRRKRKRKKKKKKRVSPGRRDIELLVFYSQDIG